VLWNKRREIWPSPPDADAFFPVRPDVFVRSVLDIELLEPDHIESEDADFEVAGKTDRNLRQIVVAQRICSTGRRSTALKSRIHFESDAEAVARRRLRRAEREVLYSKADVQVDTPLMKTSRWIQALRDSPVR
jgi:hypothetical protein